MKSGLREAFLTVALFGGCLAGDALVAVQQGKLHPPSQGAAYLENHGYRDVRGGDEQYYFNTCVRDDMSRTYKVTTPDGRRGTRSVCFGYFGPYLPLFGR